MALPWSAPVHAQDVTPAPVGTGTGAITGVVVAGHNGELLPATAVEVWSVADSSLIAQAVTDADGTFQVRRLAEGEFYLRLVHLDYGTVETESFELVDAEARNLGTLRFPVEVVALEPIEVSVERAAVTFEADRTAYIVGLMPGTEGVSVTEAFRSIPELAVDIDGRVTLRGNEPAIYINGRPAPMTREALALFLEQFPADYLQKVEVIDNPSARYGAEGGGGIVNLVMKKGVELGASASVFANTGTRGQFGAGGRGSFQRGSWSFNGDVFLNLLNSERTGYDLRQNLVADPPFLRQDLRSDQSGLSSSLHLDARYEPTERTRFFAQGRVSLTRSESSGLRTTTHMDDTEAPILIYDRTFGSDSRNLSADISTGFAHQWGTRERETGPRQHELEIELRLQSGTRSESSREEIVRDSALAGGVLVPAELTLVDEGDAEQQASLDVDYTRPWGDDGRIKVGFRSAWEQSDRERLMHLLQDPKTAPEGERSDEGFEQRLLANAVYTTLQRQVGDFSIEAGLRAEHVELRLAIPSGGSDPEAPEDVDGPEGASRLDGEGFRRHYLDFFPSANVFYPLADAWRLRLSYSRRIQRPAAYVLNPTNRSTDPANRRVGNPDVDPQYTHSLMLNLMWSGSPGNLGFSSHYHRTTNEWTEITTVEEDGVSTQTYQNLASRESYGASLTYSMRRREGWGGEISLSGLRYVRNASNLAERYSGDSFQWSAQANLSARLLGALALEGIFSYSPPTDLPQGRRSEANYTADLGLRYQCLDDRASIRLSLEDPFGLRESSSRIQDVSYVLIGHRRESTRSARLSVSYTLGSRGRMRRRAGR